jgi:hypothetical protein
MEGPYEKPVAVVPVKMSTIFLLSHSRTFQRNISSRLAVNVAFQSLRRMVHGSSQEKKDDPSMAEGPSGRSHRGMPPSAESVAVSQLESTTFGRYGVGEIPQWIHRS